MDESSSICTEKIACVSFGIIVCFLIFIAMFFNCIVRCVHSSQPSHPPPSLSFITATLRPPNVALFEQSLEPKSWSSCRSFENENCAVCLGEFEEGEIVRVLPRCKHVYHKECIDEWLIRSLHCPVCRDRVVHSSTH